MKSAETQADESTEATKTITSEKDKNNTATTSASAFNNSGLAGFATQASPFLQAGGKSLSSFASPSGSQSPFGTVKPSAPSVFGGGGLSNGASPFGQLGGASKTFGGSPFGGGFTGAAGNTKLTSFASAGQGFQSKPAKPFGAPESDQDDEDETEEGASGDDGKNASEEGDIGEKSGPAEEKKKTKLQRGKFRGHAFVYLNVHSKYHNSGGSEWRGR